MKRSRLLVLGFILILLSLTFAGCGKAKSPSTDSGNNKAPEQKIVIRWGHFAGANDPLELGIQEMAKRVSERTKGQVEIKTFPNSQLGSIPDMFKQLQEGSLQMMFVNSAEIGNTLPDFTAFDAPFVFDDVKHAREFARSDMAQAMAKKLLAAKDVRVLDASSIFGARHLSTKSRPIKTPADLKGLKIRVGEAETRVSLIKAWGGNPVVTPTSEMYVAMQTGLADGQESPLSWQVKNKYWEVQKYVMLTGHYVQNENIVINEKFYAGLPADVQKILKEESSKLADYVSDSYQELDQKASEELKSNGMTIVSDIDKAAFRKASQSVWTKYEKNYGKGTPEKIANHDYKVLTPEEWQNY